MNLIYKIIIIFILTYVLFYVNLYNISDDSPIKLKVYIFFGIFMINFFISVTDNLLNNRVLEIRKHGKKSIMAGIAAVIGIGIHNDLNNNNNKIIMTGFITLSIFTIELIDKLF